MGTGLCVWALSFSPTFHDWGAEFGALLHVISPIKAGSNHDMTDGWTAAHRCHEPRSGPFFCISFFFFSSANDAEMSGFSFSRPLCRFSVIPIFFPTPHDIPTCILPLSLFNNLLGRRHPSFHLHHFSSIDDTSISDLTTPKSD